MRTPPQRDVDRARCLDRVPHPVERVVGVDQHHGVVRHVLHEGDEGLALVLEGHDVGVRHRADRLEAVAHRRRHVRGAARARDRGRARRLHRRIHAVVAPRGEVDQPAVPVRAAAADRDHDAGSLGRNRGLEVELIEQQGLEQLPLDARRRHAQERFVLEDDRALRHRIDVPRKAQAREVVQERLLEPDAVQVLELARAEPHRLDEREGRAGARRQEPLALRRQLPHEQLEHRHVVHAAAVIARGHRELVLVDQQRCLGRRKEPGIIRVRVGGHRQRRPVLLDGALAGLDERVRAAAQRLEVTGHLGDGRARSAEAVGDVPFGRQLLPLGRGGARGGRLI